MKPTYRRSWAGNLLMFSGLTLGPSFNVKRWFTGFVELSFRWRQICISSPMRRSSFICYLQSNYISICDMFRLQFQPFSIVLVKSNIWWQKADNIVLKLEAYFVYKPQ